MAVILSISSQVVRGAVGNSATQFVLQRMGHEVWSLPTVLFSNHPAQESFGGVRLRDQVLRPVLEALDLGEHLGSVDAVMTGYLPTREHVAFAREALELVRAVNDKVLYICDPVMGEDARPGKPQGLFLDTAAAERQRTELVSQADILTPNRFELEWLAMRPVLDEETALRAIDALGVGTVLATSIPGEAGQMVNLLAGDSGAFSAPVEQLASVPHGTGDMLTAVFAGALLDGKPQEDALGFATAAVQEAIRDSIGNSDLQVVATQAAWSSATPVPVRPAKVIA